METVMRSKEYDSKNERLILDLQGNPEKAVDYINTVLEKGEHDEVIFASSVINAAFGGFLGLADKADFDFSSALKKLISITDRHFNKSILTDFMMGSSLQPFENIEQMYALYSK